MARRKTKKVKLSPKATLLLTVLVVIYTLARPYLVPSVSIDEVPEYDGVAYVEINGNQPDFEEKDLTEKSYESYSLLDGLGRCGRVNGQTHQFDAGTSQLNDLFNRRFDVFGGRIGHGLDGDGISTADFNLSGRYSSCQFFHTILL